jgi:hypothetical protein
VLQRGDSAGSWAAVVGCGTIVSADAAMAQRSCKSFRREFRNRLWLSLQHERDHSNSPGGLVAPARPRRPPGVVEMDRDMLDVRVTVEDLD